MNLLKNRSNLEFSLLVLACVFILSFAREPLFFLEPRIWAEEGTVHISSIFSNGLWVSLWQPHLGYYSLFNNYVTSLGLGLMGLERVAYITTALSFFIATLTVAAPLILPSKQWDTRFKRTVIIFFSLFIGTAEIWVNTINAQFYFGLFTSFLLLSNTKAVTGWRCYYVLGMLFQAAFTGVTSVIFLPFFVWKFMQEKSMTWFEKSILVILLFGLITQLVALFYLGSNTGLGRFSLGNIQNFPYGVYYNLTSFIAVVGNTYIRLFLLLVVVAFAFNKKGVQSLTAPIVLAAYVSVVFAFLALGMGGGGRYGYIPAVLLFTSLVNSYASVILVRILKLSIIIFLLIVSFVAFFDTKNFYNSGWVSFSLENIYENNSGELEMKLFPQWSGTNWVLKIPNEQYEHYK